MESSGFGFRVLERHHPVLPAGPKIVLYRLDPATLDFAHVSGSPEQLLGFPRDEWYRPRFWFGRLHPEDQEAVRAYFKSWAASRRDEQLAYRVIDAAGQTVWVHQVIAIGSEACQQVTIRGVLMDITERIAQAADIEKALFLKAELLRIVAEELAPPVRAISLYGEMLERHLSAQRDDVGSDYAVGLRDGLQRLDGILGQLMRVAQSGGPSIDEMNAGLSLLRGGDPAG